MSEMKNGSCCHEVTEEEMYSQLEDILVEYREKPGALIPVLQMTQKIFGYLPKPALKIIADRLNKSYSEVAGVVTFYSFFSTSPRGKNIIRVCLGTACYVRGGKEVLQTLKKELNVEIGESTPDRLFSLEVGRCFGACGLAPVIMVNDDVHQRVKADKINEIIGYYKSAEKESMKEGA